MPYSCPVALFREANWQLFTHNKTLCEMGFHWEGIILVSLFFGNILQENKIGENALFYCFGQSFLFSVSFFTGNKEGCFHWHFLRWKKFLWKIIGLFQLPPYESPINSNPAAGAINPYFCTLAKLYWNQWSRARLAARMVIRSVAN